MPFGLTNAPATFQKLVNAIYAGLKGMSLQVFIDDLCIATDTWDQHIEVLRKVFDLTIKADLRLKGSKCTFGARSVIYLGHELSSEGIRQSPEKLRGMLNMLRPKDVSGVKRALGMFSYYRKFVPEFSKISAPINKLQKAGVQFNWTNEQEAAFRKILAKLAENATLATFHPKDKTLVKCDASYSGIAGMLLQQRDGEWKIVSCISRTLSDAEKNYAVTELEGLALVWTIKKFRHYLLGINFDVLTDHCALCALKTKMPNSPKLRRWAIVLSEYDMTIRYTKGGLHQDVDCLSRAPVDDELDPFIEDVVYLIGSTEFDELNKTQIPFEAVCTLLRPISRVDWILAHQDEESEKIVDKARKREDGLRWEFDTVYRGQSMYVPKSKREDFLREAHFRTGHGGIAATQDALSSVWWPELMKDSKTFVDTCEPCQRQKSERARPAGDMYHHEIFEPGVQIAIDCMGPVAATLSGNKHVMVAIDCFTRFVDAKAVPDVTSATFAKFLNEYCGRFGVPQCILTDNASTFTSDVANQVIRAFKMGHMKAAPMHSRGKLVERVMQTLREKVKLLIENTTEWDAAIPMAVLAINSTRHQSTGIALFELTFGRERPICFQAAEQPERSIDDLYAQIIDSNLEATRARVIENQADAQLRSRDAFLRKRVPRTFDEGRLVLVKGPDRSAKFNDKFSGPYKIISRERDIYKLKSLNNGTTLIRHVSRLKPFNERASVEREIETVEVYESEEDSEVVSIVSTMRESKEVKRSATWICMAVLVVMSFGAISCINLMPIPPLMWQETENYVDNGLSYYVLRMHFGNVCDDLPNLGRHFANINLQAARSHCTTLYNTMITQTIANSFLKKPDSTSNAATNAIGRKKRSFTDFLCGVFFTNFIHTVMDQVWPSHNKTEVEAPELNTRMMHIAKVINATALLTLSQADAIESQRKAINTLNIKLTHLTTEVPELTVAIAYIVTKIALTSHSINQLAHQYLHKRIDLSTILDLVDYKWLEEVEDSGCIVKELFTPLPNTIQIEFLARPRNRDNYVYKLVWFKQWANLEDEPCLMDYKGSEWVVYNPKRNCVKGIPQPTARHVSAECEVDGQTSPDLSRWIKLARAEDLYKQSFFTQSYMSWPYHNIYCYGLNVTVHNKTMRCPPYAFRLNATIPWSTQDMVEPGVSIATSVIESLPRVNYDIHEVHLLDAPMLNDPNGPYDKVQTLKQELKNLTEANIAFSVPLTGNAISYAGAFKLCFWVVVSVLGLIVLIMILADRRQERTLRTMVDASVRE